jgi:DNA-binding winged helix-turn-helix (wHTH) protein/tetratricopeptide (TPR) repeat protein
VYSFGEFRLKIAERELWHGDAMVPVNRVVFDCIAYLIQHRDRAVGRDELVAAVWGRVDVSDAHLNQAIARARRVFGDGGQTQQTIRTAHGFGYRWVGALTVGADAPSAAEREGHDGAASVADMPAPHQASIPETVEHEALDDARPSAQADTASASLELTQGSATADAAPPTIGPRRRWPLALAALLAVAAGLIAYFLPNRAPTPSMALQNATGNAVIVLPVAVEASQDFGWVALGAMDLVADRLRTAGLPVPPSETVVTALHGLASPPPEADLAGLRQTLGAGVVVQGTAVQSDQGWMVELAATGVDGVRQHAQARHADAMQAAQAAADLLLAGFGREPPLRVGETDAVQTRLQQAQAALLTSQLDLAHSILSQIPQDAATAPEVRLRLAELDFRAGRLDQAADTLAALLADPQIQADPLRRGRALTLRGNLHFRRSEFDAAERDFDAAVNALSPLAAPLELCDALTRRGLIRAGARNFDGASSDYSRARQLAEQAGDRLRVAHVEAGFGMLQIERQRLDLATPYLDAAIDQYDAFGVIDRVVTLRHVLNDAYALLLRWPDVLAISDRQWAIRDRIADPGLALVIANRRGRLLIALGRHAEAQALVADAEQRYAGIRPEALRYLHDLKAELAWHLGDSFGTVAAVDRALETWPRDPSYDRYAYLVLLRQRSLIASGQAGADKIEPLLPSGTDAGVSVVFQVAQAEWAAQRQAGAPQAGELFERAMKNAETGGTPALVALVAQAYTDWLLAHAELEKAAELAGRVAVWARDDFDCALLRVKVFHALGQRDIWRVALEQARSLAGERRIPEALLEAPGA